MPSLNMNVESNEQIVPSSSVNGSSSEAERVRRGAKGGHRRPGTCVNCDGRLLRKCKKSIWVRSCGFKVVVGAPLC